MSDKQLGKINRATFGWGGYDDVMIGLSVTLTGSGWGVNDFIGFWGGSRSEHAEWSEESRIMEIGKAGMKLGELLKKVGGKDVSDLIGKPVEVIFENRTLKSWRLLEEVL